MKEKWFIKKKHIVSFNLLAISCAMLFTGCDKHLDDVMIGEMPSTANLSTAETTITHVDCLFHRWYDEGEEYSYMNNEEVYGLPFVDTICDKIFSVLWEQITKGAFIKAGGFVIDGYMNSLLPKEYQPSLNDLLNKLNDIQKSIESLNDAVKLSNYDGALREKETQYINLQTATLNAWHSLNSIEKNGSITIEERIAMRKKIVKEWGDSNINGAGKGNFATINFAKKIMSVAAEQKSYYPIYDMYASTYFAFERQGWAWRANCRDRDVAILTIAFSLSHMYEVLNEGLFDKNALAETMKSFNEYIKVNVVDRTSEKEGLNICNVSPMKGRAFINSINRTPSYWSSGSKYLIEDVKKYSEYSYATSWITDKNGCSVIHCMKDFDKFTGSSEGSKFNRNRPTVNEMMCLKDFFDKRGFKYKNFTDILTQCGFVFAPYYENPNEKKALLITNESAWGEYDSFFNNNAHVGVYGVVINDPGFERGKIRIGTVWLASKTNNAFKQWDTSPRESTTFYNIYCDK